MRSSFDFSTTKLLLRDSIIIYMFVFEILSLRVATGRIYLKSYTTVYS